MLVSFRLVPLSIHIYWALASTHNGHGFCGIEGRLTCIGASKTKLSIAGKGHRGEQIKNTLNRPCCTELANWRLDNEPQDTLKT